LINTYYFNIEQDILKEDGISHRIKIPGWQTLQVVGAFTPVTISQPLSVQEILKKQSKEVKFKNVKGLIDTGASFTIITPQIANELELIHTGYQKVASVQDEQEQPVFYGRVIFNWGRYIDLPLVACPLKKFDCLIGRDILRYWHFTYNGYDGSITICD
jgi:predicted aspartyl protease